MTVVRFKLKKVLKKDFSILSIKLPDKAHVMLFIIYVIGIAAIVYSFASYFSWPLGFATSFFYLSWYIVHWTYEQVRLIVLKVLFLLSFILVLGVFWGLLINKKFRGTAERFFFQEKSQFFSWHPIKWKFLIVSILLFSFVINAYPRLSKPEPVGSDTLRYVYLLNRMKMIGSEKVLLYFDRPLYFALLYLIDIITPVEYAFKVLPGVIAVFYVLSYYLYVKTLFENEENMQTTVFASTFFAAFSTITLRIFFDLHSLTLALVLQNLLFILILKYDKDSKQSFLWLSSLILVLILLIHWVQFLLVLLQLVVYYFLSAFSDRNRSKLIYEIIILTFPAQIIISFIAILQIIYPTTTTLVASMLSYIFPSLAPGFVTPAINSVFAGNPYGFYDPSIPYPVGYAHEVLVGLTYYDYGNVIPSILAILSFILIINLRHKSFRFIYAQSLTYSVLLLLPGLMVQQKWRFALLFPVPILAGMGFDFFLKILSKTSITIETSACKAVNLFRFAQISSVLMAVVLVMSLLIAVEWQNSFAIDPYRPSKDAMEEINWLRDHFGVSNKSLIVVVRDYNSFMEIGYYVKPAAIYFGNLPFLLMNISEPLSSVSDIPLYTDGLQGLQIINALNGSLLKKYSIVVTQHTYGPRDVEKRFLTEIHNGVYMVSNMNDIQRKSLIYNYLYLHSSKVSNDPLPKNVQITLINANPLIDVETLENWVAYNDAEPNAMLTLDNQTFKVGLHSIKAIFPRTRTGFNLRIEYVPPKAFKVDEWDFVIFYLRTNFTFSNARFYIYDIYGNWRYWEFSGSEIPNFAPYGSWKDNAWYRIVIPAISNFTYQSIVPPNLNQISRLQIVLTPSDENPKSVWVGGIFINSSIPRELIEIEEPHMLTELNKPIPYLFGFRIPVSLKGGILILVTYFGIYIILLLKFRRNMYICKD